MAEDVAKRNVGTRVGHPTGKSKDKIKERVQEWPRHTTRATGPADPVTSGSQQGGRIAPVHASVLQA